MTSLIGSFHWGSTYIWAGISLLLFSIQIERPWLNFLPFPPLTTLVFTLSLRWVVGGALLELSEPLSASDAIATNITDALPLSLIPCAFIVLAGAIFNGKFVANQQNEIISRHENGKIRKAKNTILKITLITGVVAIGYILIGMLSGTLDRGTGYMQWAGRFWRPDTFFSAVIRLRDIFFVLLPTCVALFSKNKIGTSLACITTTSALAISMVLGGRGLLIFPLILLTGGLWLAKIGPRAMRMMVVIIASFSLLFITVLGQVRSSAHFNPPQP